MLEKMNRYIKDTEFSFTVYEKKVYLKNFQRILVLEDCYVSVQTNHKIVTITGNDLVLSKLLEKEMLITGTITKVEVKDV